MVSLVSLGFLVGMCNSYLGGGTCVKQGGRIRITTKRIPKKYRPKSSKGKRYFYVSKKQANRFYSKFK